MHHTSTLIYRMPSENIELVVCSKQSALHPSCAHMSSIEITNHHKQFMSHKSETKYV